MKYKELKDISGKDIIHFIKNNLGQDLPNRGFLAGQSVTSVVMYLMGKSNSILVNDYDVFYFSENNDFKIVNRYDAIADCFINTAYFPNLKLKNINKDSIGSVISDIQDFKIQNCNSEYYSTAFEAKDLILGVMALLDKERVSTYINELNGVNISLNQKKEIYLWEKLKKPRRCSGFNKIFHDTRRLLKEVGILGNMKAHLIADYALRDRYQINNVSNMGLINTIEVSCNRFHHNEYILDYYKQFSIISNFDLNANQIGVDLESGRITYTPAFQFFSKGQQLRIMNLSRPWHALARYLSKKETHGYFGHDDCEMDKVMTYHNLKNSTNMHESLYDPGFRMPNIGTPLGYIGGGRPIPESPLMGKKYLELCKNTGMLEYLDIKDKIKVTKFDFNLYELTPAMKWDSNVLNGQHKELFSKQIGGNLLGYQLFALLNLNDIMSAEYNILSKKRVNSIFISSKNRSFIKLPEYKKLKYEKEKKYFKILSLYYLKTLDKISLNGHYNVPDSKNIQNFISNHPETIDMFRLTEVERWKDIISKFNKLENISYSLFGYWINNYRSFPPEFLLDYSIDQLEQIFEIEKSKSVDGKPLRPILFTNFTQNGVEFHELITQIELNDEGKKMKHCISGYGNLIKNYISCVFSLKSLSDGSYSTAELRIPLSLRREANVSKCYDSNVNVNRHEFRVIQHRSKLNSKPPKSHITALKNFVDNHNENINQDS